MRKAAVPLLVAAVLFLLFQNWQQRTTIRELEQVYRAGAGRMMNLHNQAAIAYLFRHVQENPTPENLEALSFELLDQSVKLAGWIEMHEREILPEVWAEYRQVYGEQASVFPLNLAKSPEILEQDWETLRQIEAAWAEFGGHMKNALLGRPDPNRITSIFNRHQAKLKAIRPHP